MSLLSMGSVALADPIACIKAAVEHVFVDTGEYVLTETLVVPSGVTIYCQPGAVFQAAEGAFKGTHDSLVELRGSTNVTIIGCKFRLLKETYTEENGYPQSEFRHAIRIIGATNVRLTDVTVDNSGGDGCIIEPMVTCHFSECRTPSRSISIERMVASNNYRNGLAILSCVDCRVSDSTFQDTKGVAPGAGFIYEWEHQADRAENIIIERCTAKHNAGPGFMVQVLKQNQLSKPISITFRDNAAIEVPVAHQILRIENYGWNNFAVKPKGFISWDKSIWLNE